MKWELSMPEKSIIEDLMFECGITEIQAKLLINRGITNVEDANLYLYGDLRDLYDPSLLAGMDETVKVLKEVYEKKEKICISSDFDNDGISACAITYLAFDNLGIETDFYVPHRVKEGYGLSPMAVDKIAKKGFKYIYTVDNGIAAVSAVERANELGIKVLVTDHHDIPKELPKAVSIVNPKLPYCKYPNKKLCGGSVTWKVLIQLYKELNKDIEFLYDLLPIVAMATLGDMMDLDGENRLIVKEGLKRLNQGTILPLLKLKEVFKIEEVNSSECYFKLIPSLNSDGRLSDCYLSTNFLIGKDIRELELIFKYYKCLIDISDDNRNKTINELEVEYSDENIKEIIRLYTKVFKKINKEFSLERILLKSREFYNKRISELEDMANKLFETNEKRKQLTMEHMERCLEKITEENLDKWNIIVLFLEDIPEGIVGLIAGRIKEKYNKPTFVLTNGEGCYKGSGRGVEGHPFSLFEGLQITKDLWVKGGGHPMAAGLSFDMDISKINEFRERLDLFIKTLLEKNPFTPTLKIDGIINQPTEELLREIELLEPTGKGNRGATFGTDTVSLVEARPVGEDQTHLRVKTVNDVVGIGFSMVSRYSELNMPNSLKIAYTPQLNVWSYTNKQNELVVNRSIQMLMKDINSPYETISNNKNMLISSIKQNINNRL